MPTWQEINELVKYCDFETGSLNDVVGSFVIGPIGNSIFIPYAGYRLQTRLYYDGRDAHIWSGTQSNNGCGHGCRWGFNDGELDWKRECGQSVRPVSD